MQAPLQDGNAAPKNSLPCTPQQELVKYIAQFMPISAEMATAITEHVQVDSFKKGDFLLKEGQTAKICYFVLKGCIRQYFVIDGEEKTTNFFTEGQPVTPYEGTYKNAPATFYLSCLEDCLLTVGSPEGEVEFFKQFPALAPARGMAVEEEWGKSQERLTSYILNSPEERYLRLLKTRPDLLDRVPQYHLASYLGITPESLSRIRKRIMEK